MPDYITTGEAAKLMGVTRESVRRYSDAGLLTVIRTPGGQRRIDRSSVHRIITERAPIEDGPNLGGA